MKGRGLGGMLARYVGAAIGVGVLLLALNAAVFLAFLAACYEYDPQAQKAVVLIADGVSRDTDGTFIVSDTARQALDTQYAWAMQLDEAGNVIWSDRMPETLPRRYGASDIANFTRWYLDDYPVYSRSDVDGLLVLAGARGSEWKYLLVSPLSQINRIQQWLPVVLILNLAAVLALALLLGWRMFRAVKPVTQGISDLAVGESVELPERGVLGRLSEDLNCASNKLCTQRMLLDRRDRTRTEWIAGVSHDVRTPLSLVQGSAAQLEADGRLPADARQKAALIRTQSQRMGKLISNLNLASKLEYGLQPLQYASFRPAELLRSAAAETLNGSIDARITLNMNIPKELETLTAAGDEALLARAVGNLLHNSIEHSTDTISIHLLLRCTEAAWQIEVTDNGPGLPDAVLRRLRAPDPETLPAHGLGLVLVRQIMQAHGGFAQFLNINPGLRVILTIPRNGG